MLRDNKPVVSVSLFPGCLHDFLQSFNDDLPGWHGVEGYLLKRVSLTPHRGVTCKAGKVPVEGHRVRDPRTQLEGPTLQIQSVLQFWTGVLSKREDIHWINKCPFVLALLCF